MDMDNQQKNDKQPAQMGENSGNDANAKSITNIYYDCLERIFDFLDLESLLNVANTCKRLQTAAAVKFGDVYVKPEVGLNIYDWGHQGIKFFNGFIHINGVKFCLPFLRCFGAKIPSLIVRYDKQKLNAYVNQYINQYCAKTLKTIYLHSAPGFSIGNFPNPFECVEEVTMTSFKVQAQFAHLFPKLRCLNMFGTMIDENHANAQFPKLEKLCIMPDHERFITKQGAVNLLHANPQLQEFELQMGFQQWDATVPEVLNMINRNPSITKLRIREFSGGSINQADLVRFAGEHPQIVELDLPRSLITAQDAIIFIRQLKSLKLFRFSVNGQTDYAQLVGQLDSEWGREHTTRPSGIHRIALRR